MTCTLWMFWAEVQPHATKQYLDCDLNKATCRFSCLCVTYFYHSADNKYKAAYLLDEMVFMGCPRKCIVYRYTKVFSGVNGRNTGREARLFPFRLKMSCWILFLINAKLFKLQYGFVISKAIKLSMSSWCLNLLPRMRAVSSAYKIIWYRLWRKSGR